MSGIDYRVYAEIGRNRIEAASDLAFRQAEKEANERRQSNRDRWLSALASALEALPEELRGLVEFNDEYPPFKTTTYGRQYMRAHLKLVPYVVIDVLAVDHEGRPSFMAQQAVSIKQQEDGPDYVYYTDGSSFADPLMAIAEAERFMDGNTKLVRDCEQINAAAESVKDLTTPAPRKYSPPNPSQLLQTIAEHLDEGNYDYVIAASLYLIARDAMGGCR